MFLVPCKPAERDHALSRSASLRYAVRLLLRYDLFHDIPVHISEPEVAAGVAIREALMVEAQQMQDRGVKVVNVNFVLDGAGRLRRA
jgi:hypothetical protein